MNGSTFNDGSAATEFSNIASKAMSLFPPTEQESAKKAADALYAEEFASQGVPYSADKYRQSISKVLGFSVKSVNGFETAVEKNIEPKDLSLFLDKATAIDLMSMSLTGDRPHAVVAGAPTTPEVADILPDARLVLAGRGIYRLYPPYGSVPYFSSVYDPTTRSYAPYDLKLDAVALTRFSNLLKQRADKRGVSGADIAAANLTLGGAL
jgi:hypothetical protein